MRRHHLFLAFAAVGACAGSTASDPSAPGTLASAPGADGGAVDCADPSPCAALETQQARVACAANALLATLSPGERSAVNLPLTDFVSRSRWNNLPVAMRPRAGVAVGTLSGESQAAVRDLMHLALNDNGRTTMTGILRADDLLKTMGSGYGSDLYAIAIFGTPSESGAFEVMFGGHHMAYNLNFVEGRLYPVPQHLGCEPKRPFELDGGTYAPMAPKGDAMFAIYDALDAAHRGAAYLAGQTFTDVVVKPDLDYGLGDQRASKSAYPMGENRRGVLVGDMTPPQRALVTKAIEEWVRQYPSEVADRLMADYESAYADTYFAWAGPASGPDREVTGTYLRLDGPRLWIELVVQTGFAFRNETHYHSIYHDKVQDYGGQF